MKSLNKSDVEELKIFLNKVILPRCSRNQFNIINSFIVIINESVNQSLLFSSKEYLKRLLINKAKQLRIKYSKII